MKIDFSQVFYNFEDEPAPVMRENGKNMRLGDLLIQRLSMATKDEKGAEIKDISLKVKYLTYCALIRDAMKPGGKQPSFKVEEVAFFKAIVEDYVPLLSAQAHMLIDRSVDSAGDEKQTAPLPTPIAE